MPALSAKTKASAPKAPIFEKKEKPVDVSGIIKELSVVASYISSVKEEISKLRANEIYRERLPSAHSDLIEVIGATSMAAHTIMSAAETILNLEQGSGDEYRAEVEDKVMKIFEACSFQDITGQRIARVNETLAQIEKRLGRFANEVKAQDAEGAPDPEEVLRQARREVLLLNGPQNDGDGVNQDDIDKMFG